MQKTYDIVVPFADNALLAIKDFLSGIDNYRLFKDITEVVPNTDIKPFFNNGYYKYMVFNDITYGVYIIFFTFENNLSVICSTDFSNSKDIWYQKNVHYNKHCVYESGTENGAYTSTNKVFNYIYYIPSPTLFNPVKIVANYNKNRNTVMFSAINSYEVYYDKGIDTSASIPSVNYFTQNMIIGGYNKYNNHVGGFFCGGDFVCTYELIHRSQYGKGRFTDRDIGSVWEPNHEYFEGQIVKKKNGDSVFFKCLVSHTSSDVLDRDMLSNIPKWKSFTVPFDTENRTYLYSYISCVWDSKFVSPEWHTKTDIRHISDGYRYWLDFPDKDNNSIMYSAYSPNTFNVYRLEMLVLANIDYYPDKIEKVIDNVYLTDTDSLAFDENEAKKLEELIREKEDGLGSIKNEFDLELDKLRQQMFDDPVLGACNKLLDLLPNVAIHKAYSYKVDDLSGIINKLCLAYRNEFDFSYMSAPLCIDNIQEMRSMLYDNYMDEIIRIAEIDRDSVLADVSNFLSTGGFEAVYDYSKNYYDTSAQEHIREFIDGALLKSLSLCFALCDAVKPYSSSPFAVLPRSVIENIEKLRSEYFEYVQSLPSYNSGTSSYNPWYVVDMALEINDDYLNAYSALRAKYNSLLAQKEDELAQLKNKYLTLGNRAYKLPDVVENAVWCSTMKLGNCVEMDISIDDNMNTGLPNYFPLSTLYAKSINNISVDNGKNYTIKSTVNGSSVILPLYFMIRRQPYDADNWSALGYTDIINFLDMRYMSTNSYRNGNYPDDITRYYCYRTGFGGDVFCRYGYPGLAFNTNEKVPSITKFSIFDIGRMNSLKIGGSDVININNHDTGISAYGGDTIFPDKIPRSSILLSKPIDTYTYVEVIYTDDAGAYTRSVVWNKKELSDALNSNDRFDLLRSNIYGVYWFIEPIGSTYSLLAGAGQNCGIVDIKGYEVM